MDTKELETWIQTDEGRGGPLVGASTITQQVAKSLVGSEKSYVRKLKDMLLAKRIEEYEAIIEDNANEYEKQILSEEMRKLFADRK